MAARLPAAVEAHHQIPRCLLRSWDEGHGPGLESEDLQAWFDWEEEAFRYGVNPDVGREELEALIDGSTVELTRNDHRREHAGDFARWGRRGGLATLARYGAGWFGLLAQRRWQKITADELAEALAGADGGRS